MNTFTIKDLENLSGIKAHTIRIWEQRYSFLKPSRTETNIRYYSNNDLRTILNIAMLNKYGYKISHINNMSEKDISVKVAELNTGEALQEKIINDLIQLMIELDNQGFEKLIDRQISKIGIEKTITRILFPFFEKIGILWQTGHINPAQEHLITNISRQKIIVGIDQVSPVLNRKKTFLLFLPEREFHEIGLLFVHYLLKKHGCEVCYLGTNVPVKDARFVAEIKKSDFIYLHLTAPPQGYTSEKFLDMLSVNFPKNKIIISGFLTYNYKKPIPRNIQFIESHSQLVAFVSSL
jgi:DNA-binding transcriptional MerR regulator